MNKLITFKKVNVDLLPFEKVKLLFQQRLFLIEIETRNEIAKSKEFQDIIAKINKLKATQE